MAAVLEKQLQTSEEGESWVRSGSDMIPNDLSDIQDHFQGSVGAVHMFETS